jgi:succinate-acetate transporter protein
MFPKADTKKVFTFCRGAYKNFERFIKSVSELFVLCTGGGKFSNSESQLLNELGIFTIVWLIFTKML